MNDLAPAVQGSLPQPVTLAGTARHQLKTPYFAESLRIEVSMPFEYDGTAGSYPVVYLIDGYWFFPIVSQALRLIGMDREMPPVLVVGLGYDLPELSPPELEARISSLRCRDLTPTLDAGEWWRKAGGKPPQEDIEPGHSGEFLEAIEHRVKPFIRSRYRVNGDETLAGFSFGGLFTLHTLFRQPECFSRYVAASPALWWDEGVLFDFEREYARAHDDLNKRLFLSMGACEESGVWAPFRMVTNLKTLVMQLAARNYPSLQLGSTIFAGETHSTGVAPALIRGLLSVFRE